MTVRGTVSHIPAGDTVWVITASGNMCTLNFRGLNFPQNLFDDAEAAGLLTLECHHSDCGQGAKCDLCAVSEMNYTFPGHLLFGTLSSHWDSSASSLSSSCECLYIWVSSSMVLTLQIVIQSRKQSKWTRQANIPKWQDRTLGVQHNKQTLSSDFSSRWDLLRAGG